MMRKPIQQNVTSETPAVRLPRVAVIASNPLRKDMANGILMRSLFRGWPAERLAQIYFKSLVFHPPEFDVCKNYSMIKATGSVQRFVRPNDDGNSSAKSYERRSSSLKERLAKQVRLSLDGFPAAWRYLKSAREVLFSAPWMLKQVMRELQAMRPDIVYALLGDYCLTKITCEACERLGLPLYIHVTDDFVTSMYRDMPFSRSFQRASSHWFKRIVGYASGHAAISPVMAEDFEQRYGQEWNAYTTLIEADDYDDSPRAPDGAIRLVFAGNLGLGRWQQIRELALSLQRLRAAIDSDIRLAIYSNTDQLEKHRSDLQIDGITELHGWISPQELPRVFHDSDLLVHVESFDESIAEYTKLSFSTKLSQYMMAGRCILAFGPKNLGSMQMIERASAGVVLGRLDSPAAESSLYEVLQNSVLRQKRGESGRRWAMHWVNGEVARVRFQNDIAQAAILPRTSLLVA